MTTTYRLHLEPEPEGGFTVTVPALPGCVTWGRDYPHALEMAREAIEGHLEALTRHGLAIPKDVPYQALGMAIVKAIEELDRHRQEIEARATQLGVNLRQRQEILNVPALNILLDTFQTLEKAKEAIEGSLVRPQVPPKDVPYKALDVLLDVAV